MTGDSYYSAVSDSGNISRLCAGTQDPQGIPELIARDALPVSEIIELLDHGEHQFSVLTPCFISFFNGFSGAASLHKFVCSSDDIPSFS